MVIPKVSVIIPIYNTESYVEEAIRSIQNQTLREIEIIVVNDGSTDKSLEIINNLALSDNRIFVFTQNNAGQSVARNSGTSRATGEYLYYMDSDDILDKEALEECHKVCKKMNLDFVYFDAEILNDNKQYNLGLNYQRTHMVNSDSVMSGINLLKLQIKNKVFTPSPCLNFINHHFLKSNKLFFFPGIIHEDQLFTFQLYSIAKKVSCIQKPYFKRRIRDNSTMTQNFSLTNMEGYFTVTNQLLIQRKLAPKQLKKTTDIFLNQMLNATSYNASTLPFCDRLYVVKQFLIKYRSYVSLKSILRILFRSFIR